VDPTSTNENYLSEQSNPTISSNPLNQALAHALLLDPKFRLGTDNHEAFIHPLAQKIHIISKVCGERHNLFWADLEAELRKTPRSFHLVLCVLREILDGLCELVPNRPDLHQKFHEAIDTTVLTERLNATSDVCNELLPVLRFATQQLVSLGSAHDEPFILQWLQKSEKLAEMSSLASCLPVILREFCENLRHVQLSMANFLLEQLAPVIADHGIAYEQKNFAAAKLNGIHGEQKTTAWIRHAYRLAQCLGFAGDDCPTAKLVTTHRLAIMHIFEQVHVERITC
jgi:hypothetical protein